MTADISVLGSLHSVDGEGVERMEDRFDTGIDDLWGALTEPDRLARWYGEVEGELSQGGEFKRVGAVGGCVAPAMTTLCHTTVYSTVVCPGRWKNRPGPVTFSRFR